MNCNFPWFTWSYETGRTKTTGREHIKLKIYRTFQIKDTANGESPCHKYTLSLSSFWWPLQKLKGYELKLSYVCVCVCFCISVPVRDSVFHQASPCLFVSSPFHPLISIFLLVFLNYVSWFSTTSYFVYLLSITNESNFLFIAPSLPGNFPREVYQFFYVYLKQNSLLLPNKFIDFGVSRMWWCVSGLVFASFRSKVLPYLQGLRLIWTAVISSPIVSWN